MNTFLIRRAEDRGQVDLGWLKSAHTFSFGDYYDPKHMGFGRLRVINDDVVQAGKGFDTHGHKNMEIITYVISGSLAHKDSMGNTRTINAGEWQAMCAGTGVRHSEFNPSSSEEVHLLQIWIIPERPGLVPSYEELKPNPRSGIIKVAVPRAEAEEGVLAINQDVYIYHHKSDGLEHSYQLEAERALWLHCAVGEVQCDGVVLKGGDALALVQPHRLAIRSTAGSQALIFDLPLEEPMV